MRPLLSCALIVVLLCAARPGRAEEAEESSTTLPPFTLNWKTTAGYIGAGVGAVALVTGVVFGGLALGKQGELEDSRGPCDVTQEIDDTGKSYETVQLAGIIVGLVLLSVGSHLVFWGATSDASGSRAALAPMVTENSVGLAGVARF
jgi:hypothetical protein